VKLLKALYNLFLIIGDISYMHLSVVMCLITSSNYYGEIVKHNARARHAHVASLVCLFLSLVIMYQGVKESEKRLKDEQLEKLSASFD
jgi:hypothetical protein